MSDPTRLVNVRLSPHQEKILNALVKYRHEHGVDEVSTWSATVPNRSEFIRSLIRDEYKRAVNEGMEKVPR